MSDSRLLEEWEARQSPAGFFILALSYLDSADALTSLIHLDDRGKRLKLSFDSPVRHLYAQAWELALKACLFAQGTRPLKIKKDYGHNILKAWKGIDKERFDCFDLNAATEQIAENLGLYHTEKMFAYPMVGIREYLPLEYIKAESQRFRIGRIEIIERFQRPD